MLLLRWVVQKAFASPCKQLLQLQGAGRREALLSSGLWEQQQQDRRYWDLVCIVEFSAAQCPSEVAAFGIGIDWRQLTGKKKIIVFNAPT